MSSNRLHHAFQFFRVRVGDWRNNAEPEQTLLHQLSQILNSNERFGIDDSFHMEVTHIRNSGVGSGARGPCVVTKPNEEILHSKKTVVYIHNKDKLRCARALVTVKAFLGDNHWQYKSIVRGRPIQGQLARQLHEQARLPNDLYVLGEFNLFQIILADHQIVVVFAYHGYPIIFKGPSQPADKCPILIKVQDHCHACHSMAGYLWQSVLLRLLRKKL